MKDRRFKYKLLDTFTSNQKHYALLRRTHKDPEQADQWPFIIAMDYSFRERDWFEGTSEYKDYESAVDDWERLKANTPSWYFKHKWQTKTKISGGNKQ